MIQKIKDSLIYLILIIFAFYVLPFFIKDTGSGMLILLILIPMICFTVSLIYGIKNSFNLFYSIAIPLLFVPSIFIFYNESAYIYIIVYGIISLFGNFLGSLFNKNKQ